MKFLLLISRNKNAGMPTAEQFLAHSKWVKQKVPRRSDGVALRVSSQWRGLRILSGTVEEVNALADQAPLRPFADLELRPLIDFYAEMDRVAAALKH